MRWPDTFMTSSTRPATHVPSLCGVLHGPLLRNGHSNVTAFPFTEGVVAMQKGMPSNNIADLEFFLKLVHTKHNIQAAQLPTNRSDGYVSNYSQCWQSVHACMPVSQ